MCYIENNKRDSLLNGAKEIERNFEYVKMVTNEIISKERIRYRFPKH